MELTTYRVANMYKPSNYKLIYTIPFKFLSWLIFNLCWTLLPAPTPTLAPVNLFHFAKTVFESLKANIIIHFHIIFTVKSFNLSVIPTSPG